MYNVQVFSWSYIWFKVHATLALSGASVTVRVYDVLIWGWMNLFREQLAFGREWGDVGSETLYHTLLVSDIIILFPFFFALINVNTDE